MQSTLAWSSSTALASASAGRRSKSAEHLTVASWRYAFLEKAVAELQSHSIMFPEM